MMVSASDRSLTLFCIIQVKIVNNGLKRRGDIWAGYGKMTQKFSNYASDAMSLGSILKYASMFFADTMTRGILLA